MKKVAYAVSRKLNSKVYVGDGFSSLQNYINLDKTIIISDENVFKLYANIFPNVPRVIVPSGENAKTFDVVQNVCSQLLSLKADRTTFLLAIGGGALTDCVGFVSSIFMRGVNFGFVPTTLLSQVDASVGGKNGINFADAKNMIGVINQPKFVLCDQSFFSTLSDVEYLSGFAEVLKHALIKDKKSFFEIEKDYENIVNRKSTILPKLIYRSIKIKSAIVVKDENEKGLRRLLNFGHTVGHAIEVIEKIPHGYAVANGMAIAAKISNKLGFLDDSVLYKILSVLKKFNYATTINCDVNLIKEKLLKDKKRQGVAVNFVLISNIGNAFYYKIEISTLWGLLDDLCMHQ